MTLESIYYIGQTIAVIALIASLIFVGLQMRQQNKQDRLEAVRQLGVLFKIWSQITMDDRERAEIFIDGLTQGLDNLDDVSKGRFSASLQLILRHWEIVFYYHNEGHLRDELWISNENAMAPMTIGKGFRQYWSIRRDWYSPQFSDYLDRVIEKTGPEKMFFGAGAQAKADN